MHEIRLRLNDGRRTSTITLPEAFELTLETHLIERLIRALGGKRSLMLPKVPRESTGCDPLALQNPRWEIASPLEPEQGVILRLRDPRYGWISFAFDPGYLQELVNALLISAKE